MSELEDLRAQLAEFRETHRVWSTNNARAMSAQVRDLMAERAKYARLVERLGELANEWVTDYEAELRAAGYTYSPASPSALAAELRDTLVEP